MFQTEINLFLQSFSNALLDIFFLCITGFNDGDVVKFVLIVTIFGISFRKGFILLHLVFWTAALTGILKEFFALPRPYYVDSAVRLIGRNPKTLIALKGMGAKSFWSLPPIEALEYIRLHRMGSYGFPSGHTSGAVVLWGGILSLFKKPWVVMICVFLILLIPLSRIYLGRHFLADVLGGYILGGMMLFVFYRVVFYNEIVKKAIFNVRQQVKNNLEIVLLLFYLFITPLLLLFVPLADAEDSAVLLGLNAGFYFIRGKGIPEDSGTFACRTLRVLIAACVFMVIEVLIKKSVIAFTTNISEMLVYVNRAVFTGLFIWGATALNLKLGLMKRR